MRVSWFGRSPASRSYVLNANHDYGYHDRTITARNLEYAVCRAWTISPCFSLSSAISREICLKSGRFHSSRSMRVIVHAIACPGLFHGVVYQVLHSSLDSLWVLRSTLVDMERHHSSHLDLFSHGDPAVEGLIDYILPRGIGCRREY